MINRFNLNESEKKRIKSLHGMQVIKEQTDTQDELLESLLDGSQRLQRYIKDSRRGTDVWSTKDLKDIKELICGDLEKLIGFQSLDKVEKGMLHKIKNPVREQDNTKENKVDKDDKSRLNFLKTMEEMTDLKTLQNIDASGYVLLIKFSKVWRKHFKGLSFSEYKSILKFLVGPGTVTK